MALPLFVAETAAPQLQASSDLVHLRTDQSFQFVDITELVAERVRHAGIAHGLVCVQTLHTTTGILVNEDEPLLVEDLEHALERLAPRELRYAHDDSRGGSMSRATSSQRPCALQGPPAGAIGRRSLSSTAELVLGRWQRLFLAELDGGRTRSLSILVLGVASDESSSAAEAEATVKVKLILPALTEATSPFFRPIKYSLFPPLGLATLAAYLRHGRRRRRWSTSTSSGSTSTTTPDLVAIQVYITSARRAYALADHYRAPRRARRASAACT